MLLRSDPESLEKPGAGPLWWIAASLCLIGGPVAIATAIWALQRDHQLQLSPASIAPIFVIYLIFFMQDQVRTYKLCVAAFCLPFTVGLYLVSAISFQAPVQKTSSGIELDCTSTSGPLTAYCQRQLGTKPWATPSRPQPNSPMP